MGERSDYALLVWHQVALDKGCAVEGVAAPMATLLPGGAGSGDASCQIR